MEQNLDCVVIGHNEINLSDSAPEIKAMEKNSAAYAEIKNNSIMVGGKRLTFMQVFNKAVELATGEKAGYCDFGRPGSAVYYLTGFLRTHGFQVEHIAVFSEEKEQLARLLVKQPKTIALTTTLYFTPEPILELVQFIRNISPKTKIIVGGPYILRLAKSEGDSLNSMLEYLHADFYIVESQGESTLVSLLNVLLQDQVDFSEVPNLIYPDQSKKWVSTKQVTENNSLENIMIPWDQFQNELSGKCVYLRTAISCAYKCEFCNYPTFAGSLVTMSISRIERELRLLHDMGVRYIHFVDDTFNIPAPRFKAICKMMIQNNFQFKWTSYFRCFNADNEQIRLAAESGCIGVELGIESGADSVLKNMNKKATGATYLKRMLQLKEAGIMTYCMLFVGYPGETEETVQQTLDLVKSAKPTYFIVGIFYYDKLAPLHKKAEQYGLTGSGFNWKHNTMSWQEAVKWVRYIYEEVDSSLGIPLEAFSFESITYLLGQGFSMETITKFTHIAHRMMMKSLDDQPGTLFREWNELKMLFQEKPKTTNKIEFVEAAV